VFTSTNRTLKANGLSEEILNKLIDTYIPKSLGMDISEVAFDEENGTIEEKELFRRLLERTITNIEKFSR
jgi:hypothetical protein